MYTNHVTCDPQMTQKRYLPVSFQDYFLLFSLCAVCLGKHWTYYFSAAAIVGRWATTRPPGAMRVIWALVGCVSTSRRPAWVHCWQHCCSPVAEFGVSTPGKGLPGDLVLSATLRGVLLHHRLPPAWRTGDSTPWKWRLKNSLAISRDEIQQKVMNNFGTMNPEWPPELSVTYNPRVLTRRFCRKSWNDTRRYCLLCVIQETTVGINTRNWACTHEGESLVLKSTPTVFVDYRTLVTFWTSGLICQEEETEVPSPPALSSCKTRRDTKSPAYAE